MPKQRPEESWAADCLRLAMPDVDIQLHDDNSQPSMHDFNLIRGGIRFGICEVTSATDGEAAASWSRLNGSGEVMFVEGLTRNWLVEISAARKERRLKRELPVLLRLIEGQYPPFGRNLLGFDGVYHLDHLNDLGIVSLYSNQLGPAGQVLFTIDLGTERTGGAVPKTGDALANWLGVWLAQPVRADNSRKLLLTEIIERHIFLIIPIFSLAPFPVVDVLYRDNGPLPTIEPLLPDGITNVWVASSWSSGEVFSWSREHGWRRTPKSQASNMGEK